MKKLPAVFNLVLLAGFASAHDHAEVRLAPGNPSQLAIETSVPTMLATYFPLGESPSGFLPVFPGGAFACELTFSAFEYTPPPPLGAIVRIEIVSVTGPAGGAFSFWEINATSPTITRPVDWAASAGDKPGFVISQDGSGYGHIHGRVFAMSQPGLYQVTFRAVDTTGQYAASNHHLIQFNAIAPPQIAISKVGNNIRLAFTGRPDLVYDVQSSTTLQPHGWMTIGDPLDGNGGLLEFTDPIAGRPRAFYRLVEYQ